MESTADGILVADGKGAMVRFNARFTEVCGIPEAIAASKDDDATLGFVLDQLKEPELFLQAVRDLYASPEKTSFDVLELKDGRVLERYSQPQRIDDSVVGRVWSFRDVTERKRAEQALRLQSRLQQLLMGMSAKYIDLPLEEVGAAIDDSLRELGGGSSRPTGPTWSTMTSTGRSARAPTHGAPRALSRRSTPCRR